MNATPTVTVPTEVWAPDPERNGYLKLERRRTVHEVFEDLHRILGQYPEGAEENFGIFPTWRYKEPAPEWPQGRLVVFPVTGGSEGHYVHVEVLTREGEHHLLIIGKTFQGKDAAWAFARRLADLLDV